MDAKQLQAIREDFGFIVSTDQDPDLLGYLVNCFLDDQAKQIPTAPPLDDGGKTAAENAEKLLFLKKFVEHARETLRQNPPMTLTYAERGLSVQLQNFQMLTLVEPKQEEQKPPKPIAVPITETSNRGGGMRGMRWQDTTNAITGVDEKRKKNG